MAKLFRSNRSQAVRLPKAHEFPPGVTEVEVVTHGKMRILVPKVTSWAEFFELQESLGGAEFDVEPREGDQERDFPWP